MHRIIKLYAFILVLPFFGYSQTTITDNRDGQSYRITRLGDLYWMIEDLRFNSKESVCFEECNEIQFYNFENLKNICPEGWRLPTMLEWDFLANSFEDAQVAKMMEKNKKLYRVDFLDKYNIFDSNALSVKPYGRVEGGQLHKGNFIDYWTVNLSTQDERFHMHFTPYSIVGHAHKHHLKSSVKEELRLFPARCVCEASTIDESN